MSQSPKRKKAGKKLEANPMSESPFRETSSEKVSSSPEPLTSLSQEQKDHIEKKKVEAEGRQLAKKFGAKEIGASWVQALLAEFKKPYIQEVYAV